MESRDRHYRRDSYIEGNVVQTTERVCRSRSSTTGRKNNENSCIRSVCEEMRPARISREPLAMDRGYVAFLASCNGCLFSGLCHFYLSAVRCDDQNGKYCID